MKNIPPTPDPLEVFVSRALREIPGRAAPTALEARILGEVARLAALPWWKKSFAYWPRGIRQAFFLFSALVAGLVVAGLFLVTSRAPEVSVASGILERWEWLAAFRTLASTFTNAMASTLRDVPAFWFYAAFAAVATAYAFLIGTGAAAYRYLRIRR